MSRSSLCWPGARSAALVVCAALLGGCSAQHYRKSADKETYRIIQQFEQQIFGHTNLFSIDTEYSSRKPTSIPPAEIIQDRSASNLFVVNLDQAIQLAVQHSREYQTEKEQLYLTALGLTGARYEFTPHFFATVNPEIRRDRPEGDDVGTVNTQLGVSQFLRTGGKLSVALGNDLVRYFTGISSYNTRGSAIDLLTVNLTQPLLRGFGINDPTVEALIQSERNVVYAIRTFSRYQQQFAVDTVNGYFGLVTQKDIVRNNYRNYTNRVETTQYLEARAVDRERRSQVDDARTAELGARSDYINSLARYLSLLDAFKKRLGLPLSTTLYLDDKDLTELLEAGLTPVDVDREAGFRICVEKQMEVLNAIDEFEDSKRKVRIAADRLRTEANFVGSAALASDAPYDYAHFDPKKVTYAVGFNIDLPVDRLKERNTYRATLVSFESQLRSLAKTLDDYKERVDLDLRSIEQARLNYLNALESLKVAERRVENNTMLLEAGRATIRDVREAQDGLVQAQNDLATIYADYLRARLSLLVDLGVIDTRPEKFWLQDPLTDILTASQRSAPPLRMPDDQVVPPEKFLEPSS